VPGRFSSNLSLILGFFILFCSIFVAHEDINLEDRPIPGWMYWKMKIESIRRDQETNHCWILGLWYYAADQAAESDNLKKKYVLLFHFRAWEHH
jgi:hypothetical protein